MFKVVHKCAKGIHRNDWGECVTCGGRIHHKDCTSPINSEKDCCDERHEKYVEGAEQELKPEYAM